MKKLLSLALAALLLLPPVAMAQVLAPIPKFADGLTNTAVTIKATAGQLQWATCYNPSDAVAYVQVYDTAGAVTVGTTTPVLSLPIATGANLPITGPAQFFNAIKVAATTTATGGSAPSSPLTCSFGFN